MVIHINDVGDATHLQPPVASRRRCGEHTTGQTSSVAIVDRVLRRKLYAVMKFGILNPYTYIQYPTLYTQICLSLFKRLASVRLIRLGRPSPRSIVLKITRRQGVRVFNRIQRVAVSRVCFNLFAVVRVRLPKCISTHHYHLLPGGLTNGRPQYVHQQIWGLSVLIKILGWPSGPPPPSHETTFLFVQRTGCLWMSSIADSGRG